MNPKMLVFCQTKSSGGARKIRPAGTQNPREFQWSSVP
jgi:hypothetical protein